MDKSEPKYDVFISHASEDRKSIVFPLSSLLSSFGIKVWFDQFELKVGDSLSRAIDKGLAQSRYGVVIISPYFLKKDWPDYELRGLVSKEIQGKKVILPIWHGITREELINYSPTLADKYALESSKFSLTVLTMKIIEVIRPDIYQNIYRSLLLKKYIAELPITEIPIKDIKVGEPRHATLPISLIVRIRINHKIFSDVLDQSLEDAIYNFRCDTDPEREVAVWERMGTVYLEMTYAKDISIEKKQAILKVLLNRSMGPLNREEYNKFAPLTTDDVEHIILLYEMKDEGSHFEL